MSQIVEPRVRRVVAEHLGVGAEDLTPEVSLVDDLAADSLDLVELSIELEGQFGIVLPESTIDGLRTYGDLVEAVQMLVRSHREAEAAAADSAGPPKVLARLISPPSGNREALLERAGWLTPYTAQTIAEDALTAGPGARLELTVPANLSDIGLARLQSQFAWLGERGVRVSVQRDPSAAGRGRTSRARIDAA